MLLLNYESDCSILDSSIPPKGISQKQWKKNRQDTVKSIKDSNYSSIKSKSSPKGSNAQNEFQKLSENNYSSNGLISSSFSMNSIDENIKTPKRFKNQSKDVSTNKAKENKADSKSKNSIQNQSDNKITERNSNSKHQIKNDGDKKSKYSNFQDSSSIVSATIEDYQKDLWFQRSMKQIASINSSGKQDNFISSIESSKDLSNDFGSSFKEKKNRKEVKEESNKTLNNEKSSSEVQVEVDINIDNESKSEDNDGSEIINVSCNRSGKINTNNVIDRNIQNSDSNADSSIKDAYSVDINNEDYSNNSDNDNVDNDNVNNDNNIYENGNEISNKKIPKRSNYKDTIKWEFKSFNNIFDVESPKGSNIHKKAVKQGSNLQTKTPPNNQEKAPEKPKKKKIVKKQRKISKKAKIEPDSNNQSQILIPENKIESELGQLELPSSSAYEIRPKLGSSDIEMEVNFFENEDLIKSPQPSYISHINRYPIKTDKSIQTSSKEDDPNIVTKSSYLSPRKDKNVNHRKKSKNYPFDEGSSSEAHGDFLVDLHKNADILSSSTEKDDQNEHKDKTVSMNGIVLFMLSSSDAEASSQTQSQSSSVHENDGQTFTVSTIGNVVSSSTVSEKSYNHNDEEEIEKNSVSGFEFERKIENLNTVSNLNTTPDTQTIETIETETRREEAKRRRRKRRNLVASLTVVQAKGLPSLDVPRRDPYCIVGFKGSHDTMKTKVMRDTTSPIWNSKLCFDVKRDDVPIVFTVRYEDKFGGDIDVAVGEISLKNAEGGKFYESWIRLHPVNSGGFAVVDKNSVTSACELFITLVLENKRSSSTIASKPSSPKTPQNSLLNSPKNISSQKVHVPSSTPSPFGRYDGEVIVTVTVVQAKNVALPPHFPGGTSGLYCAVNVIGRKDVRKTKTVSGASSPIWDKQFKFILANRHDMLAFNIRAEDRSRGDICISRAEIGVDQIPLNSFADKRAPLRPLKKPMRLPIRSDSVDEDGSEGEANLEAEIDLSRSAGELHFTLVLEPRLKDIPVSPRASPSPFREDVFNDFGYPESPMTYYVHRESENDEN